jgi:hypothetical protein
MSLIHSWFEIGFIIVLLAALLVLAIGGVLHWFAPENGWRSGDGKPVQA